MRLLRTVCKTLLSARTLLLLSASCTAVVAQAALVNRGGGLIYDSSLNVTWLADMNYAKTSGYDSDGAMSWSVASTWASDLTYGAFTDWRLASINELQHLFMTDLGTQANTSVLNQAGDTNEQKANLALFSNVQARYYWSGTERSPGSNLAWDFRAGNGVTSLDAKYLTQPALAVRSGDVAATLPEPKTLALVLLALCATAVARKKRSGARS